MRRTEKPVKKCYSCGLNLGSYCWLYKYPRGQWRDRKRCPAFDDPEILAAYVKWSKQPDVRSRKELRRDFFRKRKRTNVRRAVQAR